MQIACFMLINTKRNIFRAALTGLAQHGLFVTQRTIGSVEPTHDNAAICNDE